MGRIDAQDALVRRPGRGSVISTDDTTTFRASNVDTIANSAWWKGRVLRSILLLGMLAVGATVLAVGWDTYSEILSEANPAWLILAVAFLMLGNLTSALLATELLRSRGNNAPASGVARVVLVSNMAKYVPGFVLQMATFYKLSLGIGLVGRQAWLLLLETTWLILLAAAAVGSLSLLLVDSTVPVAVSALVLGSALVLAAPRVRDLLLRAVRLVPRSEAALGNLQPKAASLAILGVVALGFHGVALARGVGADDLSWLEATAALAGGWIVGLLFVVFPGGLGPREVAATALLAQFTDPEVAVLIVVLSRLASVVADLLMGAAALIPAVDAAPAQSQRQPHSSLPTPD
ncbi:MAG: hypothetical protein ACR2PK_10935 [Acidimicrobiales bacterium]